MLSVGDLFSQEFSNYCKEELWEAISHYYCIDESDLVSQLRQNLPHNDSAPLAKQWIDTLRERPDDPFSVAELMTRFGLSSDEGIVLLALAEALLRVPDSSTAEALIADKLQDLDIGNLPFNNRSAHWTDLSAIWGIAIGQQLISHDKEPHNILDVLWSRLGNKAVHSALKFALEHIGKQFVFAETIHEALDIRTDYSPEQTAFSFDMLGEAAICQEDVDFYFNAYLEAIQAAGAQQSEHSTSISIKLSALHPRLENSKIDDVQTHLLHRLFQLIATARNLDIAITIDAEESERLELTLLVLEQLIYSELCLGWGKLGLAVQAYSKRALPVLGWLQALAQDAATPIPVRLVKGAYWDSEIKKAQQTGLPDYPVFTQKAATDLSYMLCSRFLLSSQSGSLQPQFATHNALTVSFIQQLKSNKTFEFQRLHGMGLELYDEVLRSTQNKCRIYAPIGSHQTLLPYLVRRLLENGANSSFVFQLHDKSINTAQLLQLPEKLIDTPTTSIPIPAAVFQPVRRNSTGTNLGSLKQIRGLQANLLANANKQWFSQPIIAGEVSEGIELGRVYSPYKLDDSPGYRSFCSAEQIKQAINSAEAYLAEWREQPLKTRASILIRYAELLESHKDEFISLCIREAGKTLQDAIDEIREAIDFCYYYANSAEQSLTTEALISVTGENNTLSYQGRGVFLCISPWNFPLAIFTGQIAAALVSGNTVLAKPSSHTSLIAFRATELWFQAGLPAFCLQYIPYQGGQLSSSLLSDSRISGVAFTGSTSTAYTINQALANRIGAPITSMIAETGGQNAMIADSTALPEQLIKDVVRSAFNSAGQRCSALRVLYIQEDIADLIETKLQGAMDELHIGNPEDFSTDIGPVISKTAMDQLYQHIELQRVKGKVIYELELDDLHNNGYFVPPTLIRLHTLDELSAEVFGPVLHIIRYSAEDIERIINEINRSGYGLTLGIHSRNDHFIDNICRKAEVGNIYINRDQVGAVVATQPFGGLGLSGTGPKAGGPNYLKHFVREQTITKNTAASGGNIELLSSQNFLRK
ncbi:MAG: bifunctional proline dehydrogenase/L-glutamate gamma-semialdehyde dehydrogenase PutA [Neptuniibacter sp.]